ncbi:MAG: hypothetical protein HFH14_07335 [Lachnospiraceae bacterium]|nr:hypothetical protein [Lachnospiraceae bacterium]
MADRYANSVIEHSRLVMYAMFDSAVENELLAKNPVTKSVKCTSGRKSKEMRALTIGEPKTKNSIRDVPMTQEAVEILKNQKEKAKITKSQTDRV